MKATEVGGVKMRVKMESVCVKVRVYAAIKGRKQLWKKDDRQP